MVSMHTFLYGVVAAVVAGEAIQSGVAIDEGHALALAPHGNCLELPALCTGSVTIDGAGMMLTYLCPETEAATTVHVTVTATTTVTATPTSSVMASTTGPYGLPKPVSSTVLISDMPTTTKPTSTELASTKPVSSTVSISDIPTTAEPRPTWIEPWITEITTTTTIHSTLTQHKTITVTHKKNSTSVNPGQPSTSSTTVKTSTDTNGVSWTWPTSHPSSSQNITYGFTLVPPFAPARSTTAPQGPVLPTSSANGTKFNITTIGRPSSVILSTTTSSLEPVLPTSWAPCNDCEPTSIANTTTINGTTVGLPSSVSGTAEMSALPISFNATSTRGYSFPTPPHQIREVESSATAKPTKTGGAGQAGVPLAALFGGLVAAYIG